MARSSSKRKNRNLHDPAFSSPPPDAQLTSATIGTPANNLVLAFAQPMMVVGTGIPAGSPSGRWPRLRSSAPARTR